MSSAHSNLQYMPLQRVSIRRLTKGKKFSCGYILHKQLNFLQSIFRYAVDFDRQLREKRSINPDALTLSGFLLVLASVLVVVVLVALANCLWSLMRSLKERAIRFHHGIYLFGIPICSILPKLFTQLVKGNISQFGT